jgi:methyl-accepting chemotaxis protein
MGEKWMGSTGAIAEWVRSSPLVAPDQPCTDVSELFRRRTELECVVVIDAEHRPLGLMMKHRFFQQLGSRFGTALFSDKPISALMDARPLLTEWDIPPQELIDRALSRSDETLYDTVVVTRSGRTLGVLTISDLLQLSRMLQEEASERQIRTAREAESMIGSIHAAVERVAETADRSRLSGERISEATEKGRKELLLTLESFRHWTGSAEEQEISASALLERAKEATGIAAVIADLADRCNLLAVNAQIEAAKAGEQGRGFAVVAGEVRELADQTKRSAQRINRQLGEMAQASGNVADSVRRGKKRADEGVVHIGNAEAAFSRLWEIGADNRAAAEQLAEASREASAVTNQIRERMGALTTQLGGRQRSLTF